MKVAAAVDMYVYRREDRRAESDSSAAGSDTVEADGRKDIPRGHLTAVFIAAKAVRRGRIECRHNLTDSLLGLPRPAGIDIKIRDMVAWFIAVGILPDYTGNVGLRASGGLFGSFEQRIDLRAVQIPAAQLFDIRQPQMARGPACSMEDSRT